MKTYEPANIAPKFCHCGHKHVVKLRSRRVSVLPCFPGATMQQPQEVPHVQQCPSCKRIVYLTIIK